jgi:hypothetical protein
MSKLEDLHTLVRLLQEFELPVSPILEYAINEKIEEYSSFPEETANTVEQIVETSIPNDSDEQPDEIILTRQMIKDAQMPNGGYSRSQLDAIGVEWPPAKGWIEESIGKRITKKQFDDFNHIVYRENTAIQPKNEEPQKRIVNKASDKPSKEKPTAKKYEKRKSIILHTMMRLHHPASLREVTRRINRTAWGETPIREEDVLSLLLEMPEISRFEGKYYLK